MANDLVLDTAIRDWVLVPLSVVMVLIGVLRHFVTKLMRSNPNPDLKAVREGQVVLRAKALRASANFIPAKSFRQRRTVFNNEDNGLLHVPKGQGPNMQAQMLSDPNMAMDMMKKNLSMIIPQTLTFAWVNFFFSGFVAAKIPFPLTQRFRGMLQNGIDLSAADVSYVSSRSWYFLNLFGLRGLFSLILGEENATDDTTRLMAMQMGALGADPGKILGAEKDGLDLVQHEWALPKIEQKAEELLRRQLSLETTTKEVDRLVRDRSKCRSFTAEEVAKHNSATDCWIIVKNKVYDVTSYVEEHPGGYAILNNAGGDSTKGFYGPQHASRVFDSVDEYYIGELRS